MVAQKYWAKIFSIIFFPFHILPRIFVHLMVAIDRHQGNFSKCLHYNCILVTAIAVSKTRLVGTRIHCIRPSQVPSLGKRFYLLSFCTEPFFLEDTLSILINTTLLPILSSLPLHWPSNRLFWFTFISQFFLVHENLSRVPEYKISPNNILGGKISGKNNKSVRLSFCTEHYLDHRIQQPISKLRILFFWNLWTDHIVSDDATNSWTCTIWIYFLEITNKR